MPWQPVAAPWAALPIGLPFPQHPATFQQQGWRAPPSGWQLVCYSAVCPMVPQGQELIRGVCLFGRSWWEELPVHREYRNTCLDLSWRLGWRCEDQTQGLVFLGRPCSQELDFQAQSCVWEGRGARAHGHGSWEAGFGIWRELQSYLVLTSTQHGSCLKLSRGSSLTFCDFPAALEETITHTCVCYGAVLDSPICMSSSTVLNLWWLVQNPNTFS